MVRQTRRMHRGTQGQFSISLWHIVATLAFAALVFGWLVHARAQGITGSIDRSSLSRYVEDLFEGTDGIIAKWPAEVNFSIVGVPTQQHTGGIIQAMESIARATRLKITNVSKEQTKANLVFAFVNGADQIVRDRWAFDLFGKRGETQDAFASRFRREFGLPGWKTGHEYNGVLESAAISIANVGVDSGDQFTLALRMAVAGFFDHHSSEAIEPSVMNPRSVALGNISSVDAAFFAALYDARIVAGQHISAAKSRIVDLMVEHLQQR